MPFKQGRLGTRASLCAPEKAVGHLRDMLAKGSSASWLHLHGFSILKVHVLPSHCLVPVEIVSQIQKTSMFWCAEQPQLLL